MRSHVKRVYAEAVSLNKQIRKEKNTENKSRK